MDHFQARFDYERTALTPMISAETVDYHYGKHHAGYARTLNALVEHTPYAHKTLEEIIIQSRVVDQKIFNNAAQLFNHDFYWQCLKPSSSLPTGRLRLMIDNQFDSIEDFLDRYIASANALFGSGWCWLVTENDTLAFVNTQNAETPVGTAQSILCVIDLWEHAYYIDYRNDRAAYVSKIIRECINWAFCSARLTPF
jgi:Fe-Mn family superoxide dismutase